ncbi:hypothetical protein MUNTM_35330 [Mycobacterium sp. MUNTM1]
MQAVAAPDALEFVEHGGEQLGSGGAQRVTEGDRAAVGVDLLRVGLDLFEPGQNHRCERLVDLHGVDVLDGENDRPHPDPVLNAAAIRQLQPNAELRIIPAAGHWSMYEGAEYFNCHLRDLLHTPLRR